jgi:hypothetical protein
MTLVQTDADHRIVGFPHHDGRLLGILIDETARELRMFFRSSPATGGKHHCLTLRGVERFAADGFREGNIILSMWWMPVARARTDAEVCERLRTRLYVDVEALPREAMIFLLDSSYGAEAVAVCAAADVREAM